MYYSEDIVEEVRERNDIVDIISGYVKLQKKGSSYFGLCPFHNEKSPSFSVSSSKQIYYCFGCGVGGNVITFLMEYENYSFTEALQTLAERAGIQLPEKEQTREEKKESDLKTRLLAIHKDAARYYYYQLKSPHGKIGYDYFKNRGLTDETILKFGLGFSNSSSNNLYRYLKQKGYNDLELKESGLVRIEERGAMDKFWNRVMFPIMDTNNHVIGFGGRVMGEGTPKYLNSPETKIFDKSRNLYGMNVARRTRKSYLLVCEGYMDVIALHQAGFSNAVASLGTAFTAQHGILMKRYTSEVVLTFDSDGAGQQAALRAMPILRDAGLAVKVLNMKPYKDPDEFIKNAGAEAFEQRIAEAMNGFMFEMSVIRSQYSFDDPQQKTTFFNHLARELLRFTDEIERTNYIEAVSREYGIDFNSLKRKVNALGNQGYRPEQEQNQEKSHKKEEKRDTANEKAQRTLLTWLSEEPLLYEKIKNIIQPSDFTDELCKKVAEHLYEQIIKNQLNLAKIMDYFINNEEEYKQVARIFHTKVSETLTREERNRAFRETVIRVKKNSLEEASKKVQSMAQLQEIMKAQAVLKNLNISLD